MAADGFYVTVTRTSVRYAVERNWGRIDRQELAAIFAGGFIGAVARGALAQSLVVGPDQWPWATFSVNMLGAGLLGYFITRLQERLPPSQYGRAFLGTGICGGTPGILPFGNIISGVMPSPATLGVGRTTCSPNALVRTTREASIDETVQPSTSSPS